MTAKPQLPKYVWRRPESRFLWFRMVVPDEYRAVEGKAKIQHSLETTDLKEAELLVGKLRAQLFEKWRGGQALVSVSSHTPTHDEIEDAAVLVGYDLEVEAADKRRPSLRGRPTLWRAHLNFTKAEVDELARHRATGDDGLAAEFVDEIVDALGFDLPAGSPERLKLINDLNDARLASAKVSLARTAGNMDYGPDSALVRRVHGRRADAARAAGTVMEQFEIYAAEHAAASTKRPEGIKQDRMVVREFAEFVGTRRDVTTITFDDAKAYVDALAEVPDSYKKRREYRSLGMRAAIELGKRNGAKRLSLATQARYVSQLSPFFDWLTSERGGRLISSNPFSRLHKNVTRLRGQNRRPPMHADQLQRLINSPMFIGFLADGSEHLPGTMRADDWRFWLPLVCMFTGARIGEVAQLVIEDVFTHFGVPCIEFRHDNATGQRIKNDTSRAVAIHSTLLKIGFKEFVQRQAQRHRRDGNHQLFPELGPDTNGQHGAYPARWLRDYMTAVGLKSGADGLGPHSFRHTMADQLRVAGHLDHTFGPLILGHGRGGAAVTTAGYGHITQGTVQESQRLIESVRFVPVARGRATEGGKPVDFSHLFPSG